jgi:hypothetical protein
MAPSAVDTRRFVRIQHDLGGAMASFSPIDLQQALSGVDYPADGKQLAARARKNHASREVTQQLERHKQQQFENPAQVSKAVFRDQ